MAQIVLVLGESGTGKSTSMRNFTEGELALVNVAGKPLPFRGRFNTCNGTDVDKIEKFMKSAKEDVIVVDDCQYIMSIQYMHRIKENGWDKFNEIQSDFFNLIEIAQKLPDNKIVVFLSHIETKEDGRQKIKTIGKMLDEKITIEGLFTIVLKTWVSDGKYQFITQNSGMDTVKSPMGMFPSYAIENDLKYVVEKIKNYYYMDGAKSDEEMQSEDASKVTTEEKPTRERRSRRSVAEDNQKKIDEYQKKVDEAVAEVAGDREEIPFDEYENATKDIEKPDLERLPRQTRTEREEVTEETTQTRTRRRRA